MNTRRTTPRPRMLRASVFAAVLCIGLQASAELKLPAIFSDNMVLQQDIAVPVWGWATPGAEVSIEIADQKQSVKADATGRWTVKLAPRPASWTAVEMTVSVPGEEPLRIKGVLYGEVWLCSGQSNMAMTVERCRDAEKEILAAKLPQIRHFEVDRKTTRDKRKDCEGSWQICSPETVSGFTGTGYFFGRELHRELSVPIGLINASWGGTRIESWTAAAHLRAFPSVAAYQAGLEKIAATYDAAKEEQRYQAELAKWRDAVEEARAAKKGPPRHPRKRTDPRLSKNYPSNLYNSMILPVLPYGIRGAIWYQGEANAKAVDQALLYEQLLATLIHNWRKDWGLGEFPFYFVQLPNFRELQAAPVEDAPWAFIRESFAKVSRSVPKTGMAVTIDVGEAENIHPRDKQSVGRRLALQALAKTYGRSLVADGPSFKTMTIDGARCIVQFNGVGSGLVAGEPGQVSGFAVAGKDRRFVTADARIEGDTVVVSAKEIASPVAVRYAWAANPDQANLANKEGLPAAPFRTDDWTPSAQDTP